MKRYTLLLSLLLALLFAGCDGSQMPSGDSRLLALSLTTADGTGYTADLLPDDVLELTIPRATDLSGAKPTYRISQGAEILPLPERVEDWSKDQVFVVKNSDGTTRSYLVRILRDQTNEDAPTGSVYLRTDDDLLAFLQSGATEVMGNLVIGAPSGKDSIGDISALTRLTKVAYGIVVNPTYKGKDLQGLRNIESAGSIQIEDCKYLEEVKLNALTTVHQDFVIKGKRIKQITAPSLTVINGTLDLAKTSISSMTFPKLQVLGSLTYDGSEDLGTISLKELRTIRGDLRLTNLKSLGFLGIQSLERIGGQLKLTNLPNLGSLSLPHLSHLMALEMDKINLTDLALPALTGLNSLSISNAPTLARLNLSSLTEVKEKLSLVSCGIQSLDQVGVKQIGGLLTLENLTSLSSLEGFISRLETVPEIKLVQYQGGGTMDLSKAANLTKVSLETCPNLKTLVLPQELENMVVKSDMNILLDHLLEIKGIKSVSERVELTGLCPREKTASYGIASLETAGSLSMSTANITRLTFKNLKRVTKGDINFSYFTTFYDSNSDKAQLLPPSVLEFPALEEAKGISLNTHITETLDMPKLKKVGKIELECYYPVQKNEHMKDLSKLTSLEHITEIVLNNMYAFEDYSFLKKAVENGSLKRISGSRNKYTPRLSDLKAGRYTPTK